MAENTHPWSEEKGWMVDYVWEIRFIAKPSYDDKQHYAFKWFSTKEEALTHIHLYEPIYSRLDMERLMENAPVI
jgi:hypothetical protein